MSPLTPETELQVMVANCHKAMLTNYREAMNDAATGLIHGEDPQVVAAHLQEVLGLEGAGHLKALRAHETLVNAILAFRAGAIDRLLPDTCPYCHMALRQHTKGCYYQMAMSMTPDNMPPIEETSAFKLVDLQSLIRTWASRPEPPTRDEMMEAVRP